MVEETVKPKEVPEGLEGYIKLYKNEAVMVEVFEKMKEIMKNKGEQKLPPNMERLGEEIKKAFEDIKKGKIAPMPVPENPYDRWVYGFNSSEDLEKFCKDNGYVAEDGKIIKIGSGNRGITERTREVVGTYSTATHPGFNKLPFASITTSDETLRGHLSNAEVRGFNMDQLARAMPDLLKASKGQEQVLERRQLRR